MYKGYIRTISKKLNSFSSSTYHPVCRLGLVPFEFFAIRDFCRSAKLYRYCFSFCRILTIKCFKKMLRYFDRVIMGNIILLRSNEGFDLLTARHMAVNICYINGLSRCLGGGVIFYSSNICYINEFV